MMTKIKQLIAPPVFENERDTRNAYLLNIISISYSLVLGIMILLVLLQGRLPDFDSATYTILFNRIGPLILAFVLAQILMRRGNIKLASYTYVTILWLSYAWGMWLYGGVQSVAFASFILAVLVAGLVISNRGAIIVAGLSVIFGSLIFILQGQGIGQTYEIPDTERFVAVLQTLILSAIYLSLYIRSLDDALEKEEAANKSLGQVRYDLEIRVSERTQDLELAAEIGRNVSQIRDLNELTTTAVSLIRQRFNLYHAQLYLTDAKQTKLTLFAATGEAGEQMLAAGHNLPVDTTSLNGRAAVEKRPILVSDTSVSADFKPHKLLPDTRSETAVPLQVGNNVVGVLDLQSNQPDAFTEESLPAFVTLAGQLAIAIENSTLFTEQARLTAELQSNASFLDTIFDSLPLMLFVKDAKDLRFVRYNQAGAEMVGIPVEEMLGKTDYDFFPKEEADFFTSKDREVLENGTAVDIPQESIQTVHKGMRYLHTTKVPILDAQGQPQYLLGIADDITERIAIEGDLVKFKLGMERSADAIFLTDVDGTITYVNDAFVEVYGYAKEEAIGQTPRIIKSGMIPQENYEYFWQTLLSGGIVAGEIVNKTKDGRFVNIEGNNNPIVNESGQVVGFLAMHRDITERKQIEETIREREALLRTIVDSTPDWIFIKDTDHRYQMVNKAYADSMHLTPEEFIGKNDIEIGFPEEIVKGNAEKGIRGFWADDREIMESGETKIIDEEPAEIDGKPRILSTIKVPLKDNEGSVNGIVGFVNDITDIKEAEMIMSKQAQELQTVAELSTAVSTRLDTEQLLLDIVNRTKESFDLYHVHIYLFDETKNTLKLAAGAGDVGIAMVSAGYQIPYNHENSLVAKVARTQQGVIVNNVMADPNFLPNPLLFDTRSEMAVPMMIGNKVIGVLDAQANKINHFTQTDINIQTTLATQIAVALENARAFEQANEQASIIQATPNIIATATLDGKITFINDSGLRRLGYELDEVLGQTPTLFYATEESSEQRMKRMETLMKEGVIQDENIMTTKSGEQFPVEQLMTLIRDKDGQPRLMAVNMTDITARKQAEEAIQRNEALMRTIIDSTPDWIFVKDSQYRYQLVNKAFADSLYTEPDAFIGKTVLDIGLPPEIAEPLLAEDKAVMESEETLVISEEEFPGDGGMRYQTLTKVLLKDESGQVQSMVTYAHDITRQRTAVEEQKNLQQELETQLERVNALQRAMTREGWQAFMTATASKRIIQGFEFNQEGIKTLTAQDLSTGKNGKGSSKPANNDAEVTNPVIIQGTTIGKIGVRNPSGQPLTQEQRLLLASFTSQVAEALDRARLFEETELGRQEIEEQAAELSTVNEISELVSTQLNSNDLVNAVGDRLMETFSANSVYIALIDEKTNNINFPYFVHRTDGPLKVSPRTVDEGSGFTGQIYKTKQPIVHNHADDDIEVSIMAAGAQSVSSSEISDSYIGVPMVVGDKVIGVIGLNSKQELRMYDEEDIPLLTTLASTIAVALQNAQQFEDTQRRANREALVNEINQKIQNAPTIESAMQTAVAELGKALNLKRAVVKLNKPNSNGK